MKFTVDAGLLKKACAVFHDGEYPVLFRAYMGEPGHVCMNGFDGHKYMEASFDAFVIDPGEILISCEYLNRVERLQGEVLMRYYNDDVLLKDNLRPFHIPLITAPNGPYLMPENNIPQGSISIEVEELKKLIKRVRFATGLSEGLGFTYIILEFGEFIKAVGCDKRTIAVAKVLQGSQYEGRFRLPKQGLEVISRLEGDLATLTIFQRGIGVEVRGDVMFNIYVPERSGPFAAYEEAMNIPVNTTMTCQQEELMSVLSDVRLHSDIVSILLTFNSYVKQPPRFRSRDKNNAYILRPLSDGKWDGRELKVKTNARVLEQAIENIKGAVTFKFSNDLGFFTITSEGNDYVALLPTYSPGRK